MYINGEETSGYTELDFENYRKKYIGNIFQNFNLVNSYTVYQNVELVLLINGYKKTKIKKKILEVLESVDLLKYKNTKVSKLSGGQKQRVAIARALIKETPIIVADEPTGNLDSKTAENIIELLHEVSKDKLVVVVTHNYEQVEKYVTRKLTMHDGKIIEDKKFNRNKINKKIEIDKIIENDSNVENIKNTEETEKIDEIENIGDIENIQDIGKKENAVKQESKKHIKESRNEKNIKNQKVDKDKTKVTVSTKLTDIPKVQNKKKNISTINKLGLGLRNTFNIKIKFVLLLTVFLFLATAIFGEYAAYKKQEYDQSNLGYNNFFRNTSDKRIIIQKEDLSELTLEDYNKIKAIPNVDYIEENDLLLDTGISLNSESFGIYGYIKNLNLFDAELVYGEMPKNDNEIIVYGSQYNYYLSEIPEKILGLECSARANSMTTITDSKLKIVGIAYAPEDDSYMFGDSHFYVSNNVLDQIRKNINIDNSTTKTEFNDKILTSSQYMMQYKVLPNSKVPAGKAYVSEELNYMTKYYNCKNYTLNINIENMYFKDSLNVKISNTYNKKSFERLTGITEEQGGFNLYNGAIFVNDKEYQNLFNKGNFQSSVFIKDEKEKDTVLAALEDSGYKTLYVKDTIKGYYSGGSDVITKVITMGVLVVVAVALCFISYFIIKIILKSRNVYFSTIRILGATRKNAKSLLRIELLTVMNMAYLGVLGIISLIKNNIIVNEYLQSMITYLTLKDYVITYLVLFIIAILISNTYSKKLFKKSAMHTHRDEEV